MNGGSGSLPPFPLTPVSLLRLLRGESGVLPGAKAAEQRVCVRKSKLLKIEHRTGA